MRKFVIIVAGGKGLRMGGDIPKQFLPVENKPILMRTLDRFFEYDPQIQIVLVLPQGHFSYWNDLCKQYNYQTPHALVAGGETRYHSVKNGLMSISCAPDDLVAVHDGVRPFVSVETITETFDKAAQLGAVIPVIDCIDSLREVVGNRSEARNRSDFKLVQTPQTFTYEVLKHSYLLDYRDSFTDDASVVEAAGHAVSMVQGNRENIKITTTYDLKLATVLV